MYTTRYFLEIFRYLNKKSYNFILYFSLLSFFPVILFLYPLVLIYYSICIMLVLFKEIYNRFVAILSFVPLVIYGFRIFHEVIYDDMLHIVKNYVLIFYPDWYLVILIKFIVVIICFFIYDVLFSLLIFGLGWILDKFNK